MYALLLGLAQVLIVSNGIKMITVSGKLFLNATYVMVTQGNEVMAYWSYHPCTLLILKSQNPMVLKVRNLCPFPINVPITVKAKTIIKSMLVKKCVGEGTTTLTYPKCLSKTCVSEFPLGDFKCVKRGTVTLTYVKRIKDSFLVVTKTEKVCLEEAREKVCINWYCAKVTTVTKVAKVCTYTNSILRSTGTGLNPISINVYVPQGSSSEKVVVYHRGPVTVYAWGLAYFTK